MGLLHLVLGFLGVRLVGLVRTKVRWCQGAVQIQFFGLLPFSSFTVARAFSKGLLGFATQFSLVSSVYFPF